MARRVPGGPRPALRLAALRKPAGPSVVLRLPGASAQVVVPMMPISWQRSRRCPKKNCVPCRMNRCRPAVRLPAVRQRAGIIRLMARPLEARRAIMLQLAHPPHEMRQAWVTGPLRTPNGIPEQGRPGLPWAGKPVLTHMPRARNRGLPPVWQTQLRRHPIRYKAT